MLSAPRPHKAGVCKRQRRPPKEQGDYVFLTGQTQILQSLSGHVCSWGRLWHAYSPVACLLLSLQGCPATVHGAVSSSPSTTGVMG